MRLENKAVFPGDWITIEDASPNPISVSYISLGNARYPAYVDGKDLKIRCPQITPGSYSLSFEGYHLGNIDVLGP